MVLCDVVGYAGEHQFSIPGEQGPDDAGVLGGDGDDRAVITATRSQRERPARQAIGLLPRTLQHGTRTDHQQRAQVRIAAFGDTPELGLPPVEYCRGTKPSQAANCRPFANSWPEAMLAVMADAVSGPTPLTCWMRRRVRAASPTRPAAVRSGQSSRRGTRSARADRQCSRARDGQFFGSDDRCTTHLSARCGKTMPNSASKPRIRLIVAVRCRRNPVARDATTARPAARRLHRDEAHVRSRHGFADRLGVVAVVLPALPIRRHEARHHDADAMATTPPSAAPTRALPSMPPSRSSKAAARAISSIKSPAAPSCAAPLHPTGRPRAP